MSNGDFENMSKIRLLDPAIAELIAAGEVVDRPSSVVKELFENAVDAKAKRITVEIERGGITFMRITDDGIGIAHNELPTAFLRHATSKVAEADDLFSISTLGFRGEALPSVAAVSRVEFITREQNSLMGTRYIMEGMREIEHTEIGCPTGTTIVVRNLFFNTPVRMKFLKKDVVEGNAVATLVERLALAYPHVSVRFIRDGKQRLLTPGDGKLSSAVRAVFGGQFSSPLTEIDYNSGSSRGNISVRGLISTSENFRPSRSIQHFFVNTRYIRSKLISQAVEEGSKTFAPVGKHPIVFLHISLPYDEVDVNIHPAKLEVRFSDERQLYDSVYAAVKSAFEVATIPTTLLLSPKKAVEQESRFELPPYVAGEVFQEKLVFRSSYVPPIYETPSPEVIPPRVVPEQRYSSAPPPSDADAPSVIYRSSQQPKVVAEPKTEHTETIVVDSESISTPEVSAEVEATPTTWPEVTPTPIVILGEIFTTYILCQMGESLYMIDKHAAHERYIYNQLLHEVTEKHPQLMMESVVIHLAKEECRVLIDSERELEKLGIKVEDFGDGALILREVPMVLSGMPMREMLCDIAVKLADGRSQVHPDRFDSLLYSVACRKAIMAGKASTFPEMEDLVNLVLTDTKIRFCPHGRPAVIAITKREVERMFLRN